MNIASILYILAFLIFYIRYKKSKDSINTFLIMIALLITSFISLLINFIYDFSIGGLVYSYLCAGSILIVYIGKIELKHSLGKKKILICIAMFLAMDVCFFYNLPDYTYKRAISVIQNDLESKYEKVEVNLKVKNYFVENKKHTWFSYTDYIIEFNVNDKMCLYLFDPYIGYYKEMKK